MATEAARQGPAEGVMPVLMPVHPTPSILLVFYHLRERKGFSWLEWREVALGCLFSLSI